jgi:hypothetical protein
MRTRKKNFDGRTRAARSFNKYLHDFTTYSKIKNPTMAKMGAGLSCQLDLLNDAMNRNEPVDPSEYSRIVNSLGRCLEALGMSEWINPPLPKEPDPVKALQEHITKQEPQ